MSEKYSNFPAFLVAMQGKRLLHLGHQDADCDALGSAYALSRILPGDVGFAFGMKAKAQSLAQWLELNWVKDPDPADYEYSIIYDTVRADLLGLPLPQQYAIFDHHESGGHRFSTIHNELADAAEWSWVRPVESNCSLMIDLFQEHAIPIDRKMAVALAAGIMTDTIRLRQAHGLALRRLAIVLEAANLYVEDIWALLENQNIRAARRPAILAALHNIKEYESNGWSIWVAETTSQDNGFVILDTFNQYGVDVGMVGFPKWGKSMVIATSTAEMVAKIGFDLGGLVRKLGPEVNASDAWGTRIGGRIIAPLPLKDLVARCLAETMRLLES